MISVDPIVAYINWLGASLVGRSVPPVCTAALAGSGSSNVFGLDSARLLQFAGRLHPLLVHFPIALVLTALFVELIQIVRRRAEPSPTALNCLAIGTILGGVTIATGLANASFESHGSSVAELINWHKFLGIGAGVLACLALVSALAAKATKRGSLRSTYVLILVCAAVAVSITGHFGGTLIYGEEYLTDLLRPSDSSGAVASNKSVENESFGSGKPVVEAGAEPISEQAPSPAVERITFQQHIQPIFVDRCSRCHGSNRQRGRLRLDELDLIFARDEADWVIRPFDAANSEVIRRVTLPADDEDAMPPKGERLTDEQVDLIRQWIDEGAGQGIAPRSDGRSDETGETRGPWSDFNARADGRLHANDDQLVVALSPAPVLKAADVNAVDAAIERLRERGFIAKRIFQDSDAVEVQMNVSSQKAGDVDLSLLDGLQDVLVWLNLAGTNITDEGVATLDRYPLLQRVRLERTQITDNGVTALSKLGRLEYLNLYATPVTDASLKTIERFENLRKIYLWQTNVSRAGVADLRSNRPDIEVVYPADDPAPPPEENPNASADDDHDG